MFLAQSSIVSGLGFIVILFMYCGFNQSCETFREAAWRPHKSAMYTWPKFGHSNLRRSFCHEPPLSHPGICHTKLTLEKGKGRGGEVDEWSEAVLKNAKTLPKISALEAATLEHASIMGRYTEPTKSYGYH